MNSLFESVRVVVEACEVQVRLRILWLECSCPFECVECLLGRPCTAFDVTLVVQTCATLCVSDDSLGNIIVGAGLRCSHQDDGG